MAYRAAALQALKMFTSGQSGAAGASGGNMQSKVSVPYESLDSRRPQTDYGYGNVGSCHGTNSRYSCLSSLIFGDVKLFDQSGGAASGTKQDAVSSAGQMIMKLMMKQQMSGVSDITYKL